jgi:hypothetical protein
VADSAIVLGAGLLVVGFGSRNRIRGIRELASLPRHSPQQLTHSALASDLPIFAKCARGQSATLEHVANEGRQDGGLLRAFVSYSWDSEAHKQWVCAFAQRLRGDGVDAIIDQTHLQLGARSPEFMERSVRDSDRVLVVCTENYKQRFDGRKGGAGYEGNIITGEIVAEVGKNKFIPVLRSGGWESSLPTALSGAYGVDLRNDSPEEYRKLIENIHGVSRAIPVGPRPRWLDSSSRSSGAGVPTGQTPQSDLDRFLQQRAKLPETKILGKIWSKPRWQIWIRPTEFRRARFQSVDQCRQFVLSSYVEVQGWFPFPWVSVDSFETGDEWIAGEIERSGNTVSHAERWALYRSGQFVQNRAFDEIPQLGNRIHVFEILDTATAAFEFAARMADRSVLSPQAVVTFHLDGVEGRQLTWPRDLFGDIDGVGPGCWSQGEAISVERQAPVDELMSRTGSVLICHPVCLLSLPHTCSW